jgi:hypothetical protein
LVTWSQNNSILRSPSEVCNVTDIFVEQRNVFIGRLRNLI